MPDRARNPEGESGPFAVPERLMKILCRNNASRKDFV